MTNAEAAPASLTPLTNPATLESKNIGDPLGLADLSPKQSAIHPLPSSTSTWLKMDLVVLPVVTMMYFLSSLVRPHLWRSCADIDILVLTR